MILKVVVAFRLAGTHDVYLCKIAIPYSGLSQCGETCYANLSPGEGISLCECTEIKRASYWNTRRDMRSPQRNASIRVWKRDPDLYLKIFD